MRPIDITGQKFGKLTAIERCGTARDGKAIWLFRCDCGNYHKVSGRDVRDGHSRSCGCLATELLIKRNFKHGHTKHNNIATPEYKAWLQMRKRVESPTYHAYQHYKDRGIKICDAWLGDNGFNNFFDDMGKKPTPGYTLERIDNNKGYEPDNCRWATMAEQNLNKSSNKLITYMDITMTQKEWGDKVGIDQTVIHKRLKRGWSIEDTLTKPLYYTMKIKRVAVIG